MKARDAAQMRLLDLQSELSKLLELPEDKRQSNYHDTLADVGSRIEKCQSELKHAVLLDSISDEVVTREKRASGDPETKELDTLLGAASTGRVMQCMIEGRGSDGAERELQDHIGVPGDHVPMILLRHEAERMSPQDRVILGTAADASTIPEKAGTLRPTLLPLVPGSVASFLNVASPTLESGDAVFPTIATGVAVQTPARGAAAAESSPVYAVETLQPTRLQTNVSIRGEDLIRLPRLSGDLSRVLLEGVSDKLDYELLNKTSGFLGTGIVSAQPADPSDEADYSSYVSELYQSVDGTYSQTAGSVKMLVGNDTYKHAFAQVLTNGERSSGEYWTAHSGGFRVGAHMPAAASNIAKAVIARGSQPQAVAPLWSSVQLLRDNLTGADTATLKIYAVAYANFLVNRPGSYRLLKFKIA